MSFLLLSAAGAPSCCKEKKIFHSSDPLQRFNWHSYPDQDAVQCLIRGQSARTLGFCYMVVSVATSPAWSFPADITAASTGGAGCDYDVEKRRRGWRTVTWKPGRLWPQRPLPPPAPRRLHGAPGSHWIVRQPASATLWAGSSGGMAHRSWSRPGGLPNEGSPCHTGSEGGIRETLRASESSRNPFLL